MVQFVLALLVGFIVFALASEATTLWLIVVGCVLACLFILSAMVSGYVWAQKKFQDDVEL